MKERFFIGEALFLCAALSIAAFLSCDGTASVNPRKTDVVTITDINSAITDADVAAGVQRTNNFVGAVKMSHVKHEEARLQCEFCHHKNQNDDRIKQCAACHKGAAGRDLMHNFCIECHGKGGVGPVMCQDCHRF